MGRQWSHFGADERPPLLLIMSERLSHSIRPLNSEPTKAQLPVGDDEIRWESHPVLTVQLNAE